MTTTPVSGKNMILNKFDYHTASRRHLENGAFIMLAIFITTVVLDSISLGLILTIPVALLFGINWVIDRLRRDDFVTLVPDGVSFSRRGESGFIRWNQINEIEYDQMGFTIKGEDCRLRIRNDIEPADLPSVNFIRRFISNKRYDRDLINEIKNHAHVRDVHWYNYSRS